MKTKLIMIEGIPGSGKSTIAKKIAEYFKNKDMHVNVFNEGQAHPADLAWSACLPLGLFSNLLIKYGNLESEIRKNTHIYGEYAIIAYTQVITDDEGFYKELENYEVYDKRVTFEFFRDIHFDRWNTFGKQVADRNEINIFECVFFQNHINELQNFHLFSKIDITNYLDRLLLSVLNLSPVLIYLNQPDINETIGRIAAERVSEHGNWIDMATEYVENSPYGKQNKLKGYDGFIRCIEDRKQIELDIIKTLPIKTIVIENNDYDWAKVWEDIENSLSKL